MITKDPRSRKKKTNVICINEPARETTKARLVASDATTQRIILAIGGERIAYDMTTRITRLAATVGDHPAPVVPLKKSSVKKRMRTDAK